MRCVCVLQKYKTDMSDLEPLGELGRGTCGHVVKMRHKQTGQLMAVKVRVNTFSMSLKPTAKVYTCDIIDTT